MRPRILGVETEYGLAGHLSGVPGRGRLSASEAASLLFRPVEAQNASTNVFLRNGGRLYLDVGSHPEYATAECRGIREVILQERAGDEIVRRLAVRASAAAAPEQAVDFRVFKNNVDSHTNSYGSHENYSLSRSVDLARVAELLTPFLVTRQILCGAGRWTPTGFLVSQRADHLYEGLSALTTRLRPLINTRDEPLADPQRFRRLHVLAGDSNLSETTAELKLGATSLVLDALEAHLEGARPGFPTLVLADPGRALREIARDPRALVDLADGRRASAVEVQREFLAVIAPGDLPAVTDRWGRVLDAVDAGDLDAVEPDIEWVAKRRLLERFAVRHRLAWSDRRLAQVDLAFHDVTAGADGPRGLFRLLEAAGAVRRISTEAEVELAVAEPPPDTRAVLRSRLIGAAQRAGRRFVVDWASFTAFDVPIPAGGRGELAVRLDDPFATADDAAEDVLAGLARGWSPPPR